MAPKMTEEERQRRRQLRLADRKMKRLLAEMHAQLGNPENITDDDRATLRELLTDVAVNPLAELLALLHDPSTPAHNRERIARFLQDYDLLPKPPVQ
jgi:hypothetical protein